jgi:hypothetical protein
MVRLPRGAAIAIVTFVAIRSAQADGPLAQAQAAIDQSDYPGAKSAVDSAITSGALGPEELADAYRLRGIVAGALGDAAAATDAFERLLALSPKATLPQGTSPKITKPFASAVAYFKTHEPLKAKAETSPASVTLVVASDPLAMIAKVRVWASVDGKRETSIDGAGGNAIALPHGKRVDLRVAGLDDHGNRVVELGTSDAPLVVVGPEDKPVERHVTPTAPRAPAPVHDRAWYARWWLWGGVTVAIAGTSLYFGYATYQAKQDLVSIEATSEQHTFDEAKQVEDRGHRDALIANIGFGVAGAAALATAILYLTRPHPSEERMTRVTPTPLRGGAGLALEVPF